ncbi:uncharacterized protein LOC21409013 isoform X2 [Morus notabilis]|uniref:uncharacterized protein LOC21409013 isoform X2 n=1 Tax=Morus notabilis TaxID=981085 RepID=UPI000CED75B7|nr:uncharacterized protein LOC21409013 isoform X2 [Morus notabilis]
MSSSFSPCSPGTGASSRFQLGGVGGVSRLRSSSHKKPPEPLRRAVADCLSSSAASSHHGGAAASSTVLLSEASRTLRDYLAAPSTMDLAYNVILEHTIAERERSPAVVARCVALLKRYLLRYKPSEETLLHIDRFCVNIIAECDTTPTRRLPPRSSIQQSGASTASTNASPLPVSSFTSGALVKSLNYVRSLVSQHIPKRLFQPAAFAGAPSASRQALPTLSSLLSKSFNTQLSPAHSVEHSENKDVTSLSLSNSSNIEKVDGTDDSEYIALDVLKWRWLGGSQSSFLPTESDRVVNPQDMRTRNFIEVGAAALLVGDIYAKMKGHPWKYFGTADMPYLDQLLQPSPVTAITDSASARPHLRAITASKRTRAGPHQIWEDSPASTFRPRARPLFQYRHYRYVSDSATAAPLTLSMLEEMLSSPKTACRARAFDLILNLGVHAQLLEPIISDNVSTVEEEYSQESYFDSEAKLAPQGNMKTDTVKMGTSAAIYNFESWILNILYEILLLLVQIEEKEESVWASALSCLLYFVCDRGKIWRNRLNGLDIRVVKALLEISRKNSWAEVVHCKLISMLANMFYQVPEGPSMGASSPVFLVEQIDLIGGIEFIFLEYTLANSRDERRSLYLVLFDYVLHQVNETCIATVVTEYSEDEIQPLAALLALADAPEAFYISVKLGVEGIGEILRRSISAALSRYPNSDRLNMLLETVTEKFDEIISSFTHLDREFSHMLQITKSHKFLESIEGGALRNGTDMNAKLSWATLHSLLHSDRIAYRQNGYAWLGDLLIAEISEDRSAIWSNIKTLQQKIADAGVHDSSVVLDVPLSIWLMCGLLKSKHNFIRWGFLFVLERLLMRCKFLLDENEMQRSNSSDAMCADKDSRLEKANIVIDVMSSALTLVFQINETDRINILKMCDILFSQLCLRVPPVTAISFGDDISHSRAISSMDENKKFNVNGCGSQLENSPDVSKDADGRLSHNNYNLLDYETASLAALLLQGQAVIPMQLVARVPAALFYWPLIQLAGAATDNISLGVAVGSKGRGNLPGATSDIRSSLLLLLIGKCTADSAAFQEVGGEEFFRELLDDTDSRVAYYSSAFLLKRMMTEKPEKYQHMLQNLVVRAQQSNNEKLLENPYLQMRGILQLANDLGTGL